MHGRLEGITGCKKLSSVGGVIQGWTTLKWLRTAPSRPISARMLIGVLADILQIAADKVGKIRWHILQWTNLRAIVLHHMWLWLLLFQWSHSSSVFMLLTVRLSNFACQW
jgi:hypothetical protein